MIEKNALYSSYKTLNDIHINNKPKLQTGNDEKSTRVAKLIT